MRARFGITLWREYEDKDDRQFDMTEKFRELQSAHSFGEEVKQFYGEKNS